MNALDALARLQALGVPVIRTSEAAAVLRVSVSSATHLLDRLARAGQVLKVRAGLWWMGKGIDPLALPEHLASPYPAYVSLQTALYRHGIVSQIPEVTYAVSLAPTFREATTAGVISVHRMPPELFGGFELLDSGVKLAAPEKALFDVAYLSGGKTRLFAALPEIELPRSFVAGAFNDWIDRIPSRKMRTQVAHWIDRQPVLRRRLRRSLIAR